MLPALATLLSALAAGVYAFRTIYHNREMARMRATLDMIEKAESSEFYRDLTIAFRKALASPDPAQRIPIQRLLKPETPDEIDIRVKVLFFLNHYELIYSGFESGVLDKGFYASFMRGAVIHDWTVAKAFVYALREPAESVHPTPSTTYRGFELLAEEWRWELRLEETLRRQGQDEKTIAKTIRYFRTHPEKPRTKVHQN